MLAKRRKQTSRPILIFLVACVSLLFGAAAAVAVDRFSDVKPDSQHAEAIAWAADNDITVGCAEGEFCPGAATTREQMVTFLERLASSGAVDAGTVGGKSADELEGSVGPAGPRGAPGPAGPAGDAGATTPTYIPLLGESMRTVSTNVESGTALGTFVEKDWDEPWSSPLVVPIDGAAFPGSGDFSLFTNVNVSNFRTDDTELCIRLYDVTQAAPVPGSEACSTDTEVGHVESGRFSLPDGRNLYSYQVRGSGVTNTTETEISFGNFLRAVLIFNP